MLKRWNLTKNPGLNLSPCRAFVLKEYIRAYKLTALDKLFKPSLYFGRYRAKPFSCKVFFMASFRKHSRGGEMCSMDGSFYFWPNIFIIIRQYLSDGI